MAELRKKIVVFGGGTISHVASHLALCAPAYGETAKKITEICEADGAEFEVKTYMTRMAGGDPSLETNEDVEQLVDSVVKDPSVKIIFFNVALVDFTGRAFNLEDGDYGPYIDGPVFNEVGKYSGRLESRRAIHYAILLNESDKIIAKIRETRKDIMLVGFKTTCGKSVDEQYKSGLRLLKTSSCNLVLANDVKTRVNMVITPEEAQYHVTTDRDSALKNLVEMAKLRSRLTFTRSTVVSGDPVKWNGPDVPEALRDVVNYCVARGAYKLGPTGATAGHFAAKLNDKVFLTSIRKSNFNELKKTGLVVVEANGTGDVVAYGGKPSVGGQSQRIIFSEHPGMDSIVHFHCPLRTWSTVPVVSQREFECGSHECGKNTSRGLLSFTRKSGEILCVYLDNHGPNIVFDSKKIDPNDVIAFIDENFDLTQKTGGLAV